MADPQILNLDDLTDDGDVKILKLDGAEHRTVEMTVEKYIERVKRAREIKTEDETVEGNIERTCELLAELFETLSVERLKKLTLRQLNALVEFALAAPKDIVAQAEQGQDAAAGNA